METFSGSTKIAEVASPVSNHLMSLVERNPGMPLLPPPEACKSSSPSPKPSFLPRYSRSGFIGQVEQDQVSNFHPHTFAHSSDLSCERLRNIVFQFFSYRPKNSMDPLGDGLAGKQAERYTWWFPWKGCKSVARLIRA